MSKTKTESLGEALPKEIERVRELLQAYIDIGPAGSFGAAFLKEDLQEATEAQSSGDVIRMLKAYEKLKTNVG